MMFVLVVRKICCPRRFDGDYLVLKGLLLVVTILGFRQMLGQSASNAAYPAKDDGLTRDKVTGYIKADQSIVTPHGIEETLPVTINGSTQWLSIRGRDPRNPVLLFLHGGPGTPFMPLAWTVERPWEDYFTVVQWDQRGAGKTYAANDPAKIASTMTLPQMESDATGVVSFLRTHLHKQKIIVVGHSWGSVLGVSLAHTHPDWLYAYVGVGQWVSSRLSEAEGYQYILQQAKLQNNTEAEKELAAIAPYPGDLNRLGLEKIGVERKWLAYFGGVAAYRHDQSFEEGASTLSPLYSQHEMDAADQGTMFSITHLLPSLLQVDERGDTQFRCPIFIFAGRHDYATSHTVASEWFKTIHAPLKQFVWFEDAGHLIPEEEPGRFLVELVTRVRLLAVRAGDSTLTR